MVHAVDIVGYGRLGRALHQLFLSKGVQVRRIYSQTQVGEKFALRESWLSDTHLAPFVFLAMPDDQLAVQLAKRSASDSLFIQCSGNCERLVSTTLSTAVWYPLQSFSDGRAPSWETIPILIETPSQTLLTWTLELGLRAQEMGAEERRILHLAAVWANNFGQVVMGMAAELCRTHRIDPQILNTLLVETLSKALALPGSEAQTGPARRGDIQTQRDHLELMQHDASMQVLYKQLSLFIRDRYGSE